MKVSKLTKAMIVMLGGFAFSGVALASDSGSDVNTAMSRIAGNSGSGHNVLDSCGDGVENWDSSTADISISTAGGSSKVKINLKNARPNTHFTVWLRMKGQSHGVGFGGSPVTGGGATPLAPTSELGTLVADWIDPAGSLIPRENGFITDANGSGKLKVKLDFPMSSGAYPFNRMDHATYLAAQGKNAAAEASPTAIVDPREASVGPSGTPFMIRMVSHCQDDASHGLSPANREAWFQFP